jgi:phenylacetate-CoA ligase
VLVESHEVLADADRSSVAARLVSRIKDRIGTTARVEVRDPGGIERSVGKARRVVDNRPRD